MGHFSETGMTASSWSGLWNMLWIGVRGVARSDTLYRLHLVPTGQKQDFLPPRPAPSYVDQVGRSNWHIVVGRNCQDPRLVSASVLREVIACSLEEHVMYAEAALWMDEIRI